MYAFTRTATNLMENLLGFWPYPETLNPEKKVETLYPETFESETIRRVNGSKRKFQFDPQPFFVRENINLQFYHQKILIVCKRTNPITLLLPF